MLEPRDPFTEEYDQWAVSTRKEIDGSTRFWAWYIDPTSSELILERDQRIRINFIQCNSSAQILNWIFRYLGRLHHAELADMLLAINYILRPTEKYCPRGIEMRGDGAVLLNQWLALAKPKRQPIKPSIRFQVLKRDDYRCQMCGATAQDGAKLEIDHIHPVSKGGGNEPSNLQVLCRDCNAGKRDQLQ